MTSIDLVRASEVVRPNLLTHPSGTPTVSGGSPQRAVRGGGTAYLAEAVTLGCDTFLTGEGSLHTELFAREHGMSLVFATHAATQFPSVCVFVESVAAELEVEWLAIHEDPQITGGGRAPIELGWSEAAPQAGGAP